MKQKKNTFRSSFGFVIETTQSIMHTARKIIISGQSIGLTAGLLCSTLSLQAFAGATCEHIVGNAWDSGFSAKIVITNTGTTPINDWQSVSWGYPAGMARTDGWNANVTGTNPYTATPLNWNRSIAPGQAIEFGMNGSSGGQAPTNIVVTGPLCDGTAVSSSSVVSSSSSVSTSSTVSSSSSASNTEQALWLLKPQESNVHFVTVKKEHTGEVSTYTNISGSVAVDGSATFAIDLNSVESNITTRNQRMRNFLFETNILPNMYYSVDIDPAIIEVMPRGTTREQTLQGVLSLHGINQAVSADVLIVKHTNNKISVSNRTPILVDSKNFDMNGGIEVLRTVANLTSIGEVVPVYFHLVLTANTNPNAGAIARDAQPAAPSALGGAFDANSNDATLTWVDNANNESGVIVRRKGPDGLWSTQGTVAQNIITFVNRLTAIGNYEYKVIAYNGNTVSGPSNTATVEVGDVRPPTPQELGEVVYSEQCVACHGGGAAGTNIAPALNTARDVDAMITKIATSMPPNNPGACDRQCASNAVAYLQTLWVEELSCTAPVKYGARQLKILTQIEYQNTLTDVLNLDFNVTDKLPADTKVGFFFNNTQTVLSSTAYDGYLSVAEEVAKWSADRNFRPLINCANFNTNCANQFVNNAGLQLFRRALTAQERTTYRNMANGSATGGDVKEGIQLALEGMLSSPQFLYRHEVGERASGGDLDADAFELTPYEMATWLAYTFTGSTPDTTLLTQAANNALQTDAQVLTQVRRLLGTPRAKEKLGDFVAAVLGTNELEKSLKDTNVWNGFEQMVPHMKRESREFFSAVMLDSTESFATLFNADFTYVNQALANHYGINGVSGNNFRRVNTSDRGGLIANGGFMARWGEDVESAPFRRAVRIRRRMLCQAMPAPPAGIDDDRIALLEQHADFISASTTTNRMKYEILTNTGSCVECHKEWMNPLAFGMEDFDTVGRYRTTDLNGNMIDVMGALHAPVNLADKTLKVDFEGTKGLSAVLAVSPKAQSCLPQNLFRYAVGVGVDGINQNNPNAGQLNATEQTGYACEVQDLTSTMMTQSPRAMLENFATMQAVRYRKAWSRQ